MFDDLNFLSSHDPDSQSDHSLELITRYGAYFALGVCITFVVRSIAALQWLYWIIVSIGLISLIFAFAVSLVERKTLIAVAAVFLAVLLAGNLDGLLHGATQALDRVEEAIQR